MAAVGKWCRTVTYSVDKRQLIDKLYSQERRTMATLTGISRVSWVELQQLVLSAHSSIPRSVHSSEAICKGVSKPSCVLGGLVVWWVCELVVWWVYELVVWWVHELVVWWVRGLASWWIGGLVVCVLVVWWFSSLMVWWVGGFVVCVWVGGLVLGWWIGELVDWWFRRLVVWWVGGLCVDRLVGYWVGGLVVCVLMSSWVGMLVCWWGGEFVGYWVGGLCVDGLVSWWVGRLVDWWVGGVVSWYSGEVVKWWVSGLVCRVALGGHGGTMDLHPINTARPGHQIKAPPSALVPNNTDRSTLYSAPCGWVCVYREARPYLSPALLCVLSVASFCCGKQSRHWIS